MHFSVQVRLHVFGLSCGEYDYHTVQTPVSCVSLSYYINPFARHRAGIIRYDSTVLVLYVVQRELKQARVFILSNKTRVKDSTHDLIDDYDMTTG